MRLRIATLILSLCAAGTAVRAADYQIDPAHSSVVFKIRHMGISTVSGSFSDVSGSFGVDPKNIEATKGTAIIKAGSANTNNAKRDGELKGDDFFNAEKFPDIRFTSKAVRNVKPADSTCELVGDLTIRDITREIVLKVKGTGILPNDGWGNERAAFSATGWVNRFDFGLKWNKVLEAGGLVVAPEVQLQLAFEGVRPLGAGPAAKPAEKARK